MPSRKPAKARVRVLAIEAEGSGPELAQALEKALNEFVAAGEDARQVRAVLQQRTEQ